MTSKRPTNARSCSFMCKIESHSPERWEPEMQKQTPRCRPFPFPGSTKPGVVIAPLTAISVASSAQHFHTKISWIQSGLLLQRCMKRKALKPCKQIHALMLTKNVDMNLLQLSSKLIGAYACCGDLSSSKLLFRGTPNPNVFAFNWMILTLTFSGFHEEAIGEASAWHDLQGGV
ncbi:hypothetical protein Salat_2363400 [Sesamum alatum]|uniref:Uncharacterized protein n=1 Tax=Sesamum alatum TaxID=300844 RepID=A0AAE1XWY2_9LAMI|nr:hypothetical protein Salat_2363400 [Sesamum alatum]